MFTNLILSAVFSLNLSNSGLEMHNYKVYIPDLYINYISMIQLVNYDIFDQTKVANEWMNGCAENNPLVVPFIKSHSWNLLSIVAITANAGIVITLNNIYPNLGTIYLYAFNVIESLNILDNLYLSNNHIQEVNNHFNLTIYSATF